MAQLGLWSAVGALAVFVAALMPREAGRMDGPVPVPAAPIETGALSPRALPEASPPIPPTPPVTPTPPAQTAGAPEQGNAPRPTAFAQAGAGDAPAADAIVVNRDGEAPQAVPRAAQIEPMVEPVKRVAPKTPVIDVVSRKDTSSKNDTSSKKDTPAKSKAKAQANVVPSKPNCDAGYKPDGAGKRCIKVATSEAPSRKKKR